MPDDAMAQARLDKGRLGLTVESAPEGLLEYQLFYRGERKRKVGQALSAQRSDLSTQCLCVSVARR